jgi:NAD(P)-dependent dehydrogenase (short-subunit alcohol dehydrogenase family)
MNTTDQQSKIVLVTGGSRGIGKSITLNAAKRGLRVILTYNSQPEQGQAVADEINNNGGTAAALQLDSADTASARLISPP